MHESRNAGEPVVFGDASQKDILISATIEQAKLVLSYVTTKSIKLSR